MKAMQIMSALSQPTRWQTFRALVEAGPEGMTATDIAAAVKSSPTTMSAHLAILVTAKLITRQKIGRTVTYRADVQTVRALSEFLARACEK